MGLRRVEEGLTVGSSRRDRFGAGEQYAALDTNGSTECENQPNLGAAAS